MNTHSEKDIDKVLTGLHDTTPSPGMEQRLLHALEHRAPARTPLFMHWPLIAAVPAAALALFLAAHFLTANNSAPPTPNTASTPTTTAGPSTAPGGPSFAYFAKGGVSSEARPLSQTQPTTLSSRPERSAAERPAVLSSSATNLSPADRQALDDANAPSQPPPSLPLSRDERTLLAAARRSGSVELALLDTQQDNPLRAATAAREDAAIKDAMQRLLRQLAAAEALNPTPPAPVADDPHPPADSPEPEPEPGQDPQ